MLKKVSKYSEIAKKIAKISNDIEKNGFKINANYFDNLSSNEFKKTTNSDQSIITK